MSHESNVSAALTNDHAVTAPSIGSSSMLVELNISTWTGRKLDKRASREVAQLNHADTGIANVHKKLLGNCDELMAVQKYTANVRNLHYSMTMPWSDTGLRLLPVFQIPPSHDRGSERVQSDGSSLHRHVRLGDWSVTGTAW